MLVLVLVLVLMLMLMLLLLMLLVRGVQRLAASPNQSSSNTADLLGSLLTLEFDCTSRVWGCLILCRAQSPLASRTDEKSGCTRIYCCRVSR